MWSPHQVDIKNVVKYWKLFLRYSTTLETYRAYFFVYQLFIKFEPYLKAPNRSRRDERADNLTNSILYVNQNGTVESEPNEIEFTKNKPPINITNLEPETEYDFIITTSLNSKWKTSLSLDDIGQAHDTFSRIFQIRIYEFFLVLIFPNAQNWEQNALFTNLFSFSTFDTFVTSEPPKYL